MSVREIMNRHSRTTTAVTGAVILLTIALVIYRVRDDATALPHQAFFTADDGKTWFVEAADKLPPFMHEGKVAYRCVLYTSDGGKTKFVSHLERYTPAAKRKLEEAKAKATASSIAGPTLSPADVEVKRPGTGDAGWVSLLSPDGIAITTPDAAMLSTGTLERVTP